MEGRIDEDGREEERGKWWDARKEKGGIGSKENNKEIKGE